MSKSMGNEIWETSMGLRLRRSHSMFQRVAQSVIVISTVAAFPSEAGYDANITGVITSVLTYDSDGHFYIRLNNQPTSHPVCDPAYFAVAASGTAEARSQMYARALLALATQQPVNIGYDSTGNCAYTWIRIHRIG